MCDRLVAGINNLSLKRKLLEKKDLTFAEARKICEQNDDLMKATSSEAVTLFQRQKTPPNRPPTAKRAPKPQKDSPGPATQFPYRGVTLQSGTTHKFIVDTGSKESIISNAVLRSICPQAKIQPTSMRILGVTGHQLPLLGEVSLMVHSK
ncbi:unnamed protein product [Echinostoma caproni]|uniref:Peptidase A2 domain-containing protein n=1 Tax=Echinostoma caproni TaxID=27848 RepID=A0A183A318_9TREM|nr:unnamed protein product [Echinostoma caproni]